MNYFNKVMTYYRIKKGNLLSDEGKYQEAMVLYDKVLHGNPKHPMAWSFRGAALLNLGRYKESREALMNFTTYALPRHAAFVKQAKDLIHDIDEIIKKNDIKEKLTQVL